MKYSTMIGVLSAAALAMASLFANAGTRAEPAPTLMPNTKYLLVFNAAIVQFEKPLSPSHIKQVESKTFDLGERGTVIGVDAATNLLAGDTPFKIHNYALIRTGDGIKGQARNGVNYPIYTTKETLSADGMIKSTVATADTQLIGFDITVTPDAPDNQPINTVRNEAHIEHGLLVPGTDKVSTVVSVEKALLGNGSVQVLTWTNADKHFALVLSLDHIEPVPATDLP
jgi:hypothetical protein